MMDGYASQILNIKLRIRAEEKTREKISEVAVKAKVILKIGQRQETHLVLQP